MTAPDDAVDRDDGAELLGLARMLNEAADAGDGAVLDELIADAYVSTGSGNLWGAYGRFGDKASAIARFAAVANPGGSTTLDQPRVTVFGSTGVTTYLLTDRWREVDGDHEVVCWVTDTWVRDGGRWRLLATHETVVAEMVIAETVVDEVARG